MAFLRKLCITRVEPVNGSRLLGLTTSTTGETRPRADKGPLVIRPRLPPMSIEPLSCPGIATEGSG